jgi:hypothetical protein
VETVVKQFGIMIDKTSTEHKHKELKEFYHVMKNVSVLVDDNVNITGYKKREFQRKKSKYLHWKFVFLLMLPDSIS